MPITTITTPAPDKLLTTLQAVILELDSFNEADTNRLEALIKRASQHVHTITNREWARERVTETVSGYGHSRLLISRTPIVTVHSVAFQGEPLVDFSVQDPQAGILYRKFGWSWTAGVGGGVLGIGIEDYPVSQSEAPDFTVDYTAGYVLSGDLWPGAFSPATRDLPHDVEQFVIDSVKFWFLQKEKDPAIKSERIGDWSATYGGEDTPMAVREASFVAKYGRIK